MTDFESAWLSLKRWLEEWADAYPEDVFVPPSKGGTSPDCYSAEMGRHMTRSILSRMRDLEKTQYIQEPVEEQGPDHSTIE